MSKRIVFMGAGAVGGYVGGHFARTGEDVTLVDPWPEHIEYIKHNGIHLSGTQGEHTVRLKALHVAAKGEESGHPGTDPRGAHRGGETR